MRRLRKNRPETIREDLLGLGLTWGWDALDAAVDSDGWRKCIARYTVLHEKD